MRKQFFHNASKLVVLFFTMNLVLPTVMMAGNLRIVVEENHDWWWNAPDVPTMSVVAHNDSAEVITANVTLCLATDTHLRLQLIKENKEKSKLV